MINQPQTWGKYLLTKSENNLLQLLHHHLEEICSRDQIAQALWGNLWLQKYSDWEIDAQIYHLRRKLGKGWQIKTIRNRGYVLISSHKLPAINFRLISPFKLPDFVLPPDSYLTYMNDPGKVRKTLADLFTSLPADFRPLPGNILIIDSYSADNIDALYDWTKKYPELSSAQIFFSHFDDRSLDIHRQRITDIGSENIFPIYDDIRNTRLKPQTFSLIVNDFRLNFNLSHRQNLRSLKNIYDLLIPGGSVLISVVVDARYESPRFGKDQEYAPLNIYRPWTFMAAENLRRNCYPVPYYTKIFTDQKFKIVSEFDLSEGHNWAKQFISPSLSDPPFYRRFLLQKPL